MTEIAVRHYDGVLCPTDEQSEEVISSIAHGALALISIKTLEPRNIKQHRLFFSICSLLVKHDIFTTIDSARSALLIATGHCDTIITPDGQTGFIPHSLKVHKMPQDVFQRFFHQAMDVLSQRWLIDVEHADLMVELDAMLTLPQYREYGPRIRRRTHAIPR